jgi:NAD-dependent DNA ligase
MVSLDTICTHGSDDAPMGWDHSEYLKYRTLLLGEYAWMGDVEWVAEGKYDGMAIRVNYVDGVYSEAALRGDKYRGRDVTALVKESGLVPLTMWHRNSTRWCSSLLVAWEVSTTPC